jgi:hypothetical protein
VWVLGAWLRVNVHTPRVCVGADYFGRTNSTTARPPPAAWLAAQVGEAVQAYRVVLRVYIL